MGDKMSGLMKIRLIKLNVLIGYILIFLLIIQHNSWFYSLSFGYKPVLLLLGLFIMVLVPKTMNIRLLGALAIWSFSIFIMGIIYSGASSVQDSWIAIVTFAEPIVFTVAVFYYDQTEFVDRFVKIVCFLAVVSLVFYVWGLYDANSMILSGAVKKIEGMRIDYTDYYCNVFYAFRPKEVYRNVGMFCEPGLYQIILNSALFLVFHFPEKIHIKKKTLLSLILIITCVSTVSTTGLIGLFIVVISFLISDRNRWNKHLKRFVLLMAIISVAYLFINYVIYGVDSIAYIALFDKIFGINNSLMYTTGNVRMSMIVLATETIIMNPIGCGVLYMNSLINGTPYVGAKILISMAEAGIIPTLLVILPFFRFAYKNRISVGTFCLLVFLYLNTSLAQSREFYPALLILFLVNKNGKKLFGMKKKKQ